MKKIGIISDTHSFFDPQLIKVFSGCDEIWHAGDFGNVDVVHQLREIAPVRGVYGNIDDGMIRNEFPEFERIECEGVKVLMIHIASRPPRFNQVVRKLLNESRPQILICGHSHIVQAERDETRGGILCINPGAAGRQGFHFERTVMVGKFENGQVLKLELKELGPKNSQPKRKQSAKGNSRNVAKFDQKQNQKEN